MIFCSNHTVRYPTISVRRRPRYRYLNLHVHGSTLAQRQRKNLRLTSPMVEERERLYTCPTMTRVATPLMIEERPLGKFLGGIILGILFLPRRFREFGMHRWRRTSEAGCLRALVNGSLLALQDTGRLLLLLLLPRWRGGWVGPTERLRGRLLLWEKLPLGLRLLLTRGVMGTWLDISSRV